LASNSALIRALDTIVTRAPSATAAACGFAVENAMEMSPDPLPDELPVRASPRLARHTIRLSCYRLNPLLVACCGYQKFHLVEFVGERRRWASAGGPNRAAFFRIATDHRSSLSPASAVRRVSDVRCPGLSVWKPAVSSGDSG
jgi:hypothetical protein